MAARARRTQEWDAADLQRRAELRLAWRSIVGRAIVLMLLGLVTMLLVSAELRTTRGVLGGLGWGALGVAVVCLVFAVTGRYERERF